MSLNIIYLDGQMPIMYSISGTTSNKSSSVETPSSAGGPPPDQTMVGQEHCTITRGSGQYFLEMGPDRAVRLNGQLVEGAAHPPKR